MINYVHMHLGKKKFKHTNFQDMYKSMDYKAKVKELNTHEKRGRLLSLETLLHKKYTKQFTQ